MEKVIVKQAINLVLEPGSFKELKNLNDNIVAYGELEHLLGYYKGMFEGFRKLCEEVDDLKVALELREDMVKLITSNSTKELGPAINTNVNSMLVALIHNINKKSKKYGINI